MIGSLLIDPIDCVSDPCHLSWLIRYNRNMLPAVSDVFCSNGTRFEDLNQNAYANCPFVNIYKFIALNEDFIIMLYLWKTGAIRLSRNQMVILPIRRHAIVSTLASTAFLI